SSSAARGLPSCPARRSSDLGPGGRGPAAVPPGRRRLCHRRRRGEPRMIVSVMLRWLRTHRAGLLGWSAGLIGVTSMYLPFYTTVALDPELMDQYMSALPPEVVSAFGFDD